MTILIFIAVLVLLIVGHEFGHFLAAKAAKMRVLEFGIGFPPKAVGKRLWGETEFSLNWIPFGGFVRIFGEDPKEAQAPGAFTQKHPLAQAFVLFAGPGANILLAFLLSFGAFVVGAPTILENIDESVSVRDARLLVGEVLEGSPADAAGLEAGDVLTAVQVRGVETLLVTPLDVARSVQSAEGALTLLYTRDGVVREAVLEPVSGLIESDPSQKAIGVATALVGTVSYNPLEAFVRASETTLNSLVFIVVSLGGLLASAVTLSADLSHVAGPVGIASLTGEAASFGLGSLMAFAALLSVNLAVVNLLPFPALDGGRLLFLGIESVTRRKIPASVAGVFNSAGFAILILLMVAVTVGDVVRLLD